MNLKTIPTKLIKEDLSTKESIMKCLVLLTALIALLGCGSDSNLITPDPSMDIGQPTEKNELPVVEDPLVEPPEVVELPPIRVLDPNVIAEILRRDPPVPPDVIAEILKNNPPVPPDVIAEILKENPPEVPALEPPEVPDVIVVILNQDPPQVRVLKPPEVPKIIIELQKNGDPPVIIAVEPPEMPEPMAEPPNGDPPPNQ